MTHSRHENRRLRKGWILLVTPCLYAAAAEPPPYDVPAGDAIRSEPTGFFRVQQADGRAWLVDPKGRAFYAVGTDHARYDGHGCEALGYAPYGRTTQAKFGDEHRWAAATAARLRDWGFNLLGAGCSASLRYRGLAHTEFVPFGMSFASKDALCPQTGWTGFPNVFSPDWADHCEALARKSCAPHKDDPWLLGYFLDNELEWYGKNGRDWGLFDEAWKKSADHSAKKAWVAFLAAELKTPQEFRVDWGIPIERFDDLLAHTHPVPPRTERARRIASDWVQRVAEFYFQTCAAAIRRHDPDHLILGCRFAGQTPGVWGVAGESCDVVSFNFYPSVDVERGVPGYVVERFESFHRQAGKPLMITEWSFPALDSGLPCTNGAGMRVDTQAQRATCFTHFQTLMFRLPFMVGSDFFMFVDEPALGISKSFPENTNYGLVNEKDEPYAELTAAAKRLHARVYALHAAGRMSRPPDEAGAVAWLKDLPPPAPLPPPGEPLRVSVGRLTLEGPGEGGAWRLAFGSTVLGRFVPLVHQALDAPQWVAADATRIVAVRRNDRVTCVDVECHPSAPSAKGAAKRYRGLWRFWVPNCPAAEWFAAQCIWVENADDSPWRLEAVYHYLVPAIGGDATDDEPLDFAVPTYYRRGGAWIDRKVGLGVACWFPVDPDFWFRYWKDDAGSFHPDLYRRVDKVLAPSERIDINGPHAFFFPLRDLTRRGFVEASAQIEREVLTPP